MSTRQLTLLVTVTIAGLILSFMTPIPLPVGFLLGLTVLFYLALKTGAHPARLWKGMKNGIRRTQEVIWILVFIGIMIPAWTAAGTIPYLIDTGISLIHPDYLLIDSFLVMGIISYILGTSVGSLSAVGIPIIGIASLYNVPLDQTAGALISGAFIGDRTSPLSSARLLVASMTETCKAEQGKAMFPTTIGAILFSALFFLWLDLSTQRDVTEAAYGGYPFENWFHLHPILLIPPILLIGAILFRLKTRVAFYIAILAGVIISLFYQDVSPDVLIVDLLLGFDETDISVLHSKGLLDMVELMLFIALTGAFNGILEETELIRPYVKKIMGSLTSLRTATWRVSLFGLGMALISCNQTLPIMVTARNLLPVWKERFDSTQLSRIIADSALVMAGLIPWNMLAILCSTVIGVPVTSYMFYAVFLWILPLLTLTLSTMYDRKQPMSLMKKPLTQTFNPGLQRISPCPGKNGTGCQLHCLLSVRFRLIHELMTAYNGPFRKGLLNSCE